jgi:hypothetical protein
MKNIRRFLFIAFGPNSLFLLYVYAIGLANEISSRTFDMRVEIVVQYSGSLLLGVSLYLLFRKMEENVAWDGWALLLGFLSGLWAMMRLWSPVFYRMTLALSALLRYGIPQMLMLNAIYACLVIRWIKIGRVRARARGSWI